MSCLRPFRAVRPDPGKAHEVASPPYDVLSSEEARLLAADSPNSFLHINKSEIDLPADTDLYADAVYARARDNFKRMRADGIFIQDETPCLYIYTLEEGSHRQSGIAGCFSAQEYLDNHIRKHEHTRKDKEDDRTRHIDETSAQTGVVLLTYAHDAQVDALIKKVMARPALYDFTADDGIRHILHRIADTAEIDSLTASFKNINPLYIADGHHRSAGASIVYERRKAANPKHTGDEEYCFFLAVAFPDAELQILPYNRVLVDLFGQSDAEFLKKLGEKFTITPADHASPKEAKTICMYMGKANGGWKLLRYTGALADDPLLRLDVAILQNEVLQPLLGITDPKKDKRIDFVGGTRGTQELEKLVDSGKFKVAFSMYPTQISELMAVAEANQIMPPKSTWFAPKIRDGILVHVLE
ncbi:MAG: DUF1015 domain-containing protein [Spirochaetota bacterium]|jgi:uncharacterized protein (DUF1015 family)|nr:DUF1015 domain-containing protein [Spirochaetota bacterium]